MRGKVKKVTEINNTVVNPEWMAFHDEGFGEVVFMDFYISLYAYCEEAGLDIDEVLADGWEDLEDFEFYGEEPGADGYAYSVYIFNENGDLDRELHYIESLDANPSEQEVNTYDDRHNILRTNHFNSNLALAWYREYEYDPKTYRLLAERYRNDEQEQTFTFSYDAAGNLLEETYQDGEYFDKWKMEYYRSGKCKNNEASREHYDKDGALVSAVYTSYSDDMTERLESYVNDEGDTTGVYYYKMDEKGNNIYEAFYEAEMDIPSSVYTWTYDENGNITVTEWNGMEPSEYSCTTYDYDAKGRQTECAWLSLQHGALRTRVETSYGSNDCVQSIETYMQVVYLDDDEDAAAELPTRREVYYYDAQGNWIKREVYKIDTAENELLVDMQTREIEYY